MSHALFFLFDFLALLSATTALVTRLALLALAVIAGLAVVPLPGSVAMDALHLSPSAAFFAGCHRGILVCR